MTTGARPRRLRRGARPLAATALLCLALQPAVGQAPPDLPDVVLGVFQGLNGLALNPALEMTQDQLSEVQAQILQSEAGLVSGPILATYARGEFEPPVAVDLNPDDDVVEVIIVAVPTLWEFRPGIPTVVWTFNGTVPGPTIEAKVGDEIVVHFYNLIDTPGGIHWHGVEIPATMDGSHVSAPATMRGESFTYRFRANRASLFWYHPHHESHEQIERGLYAAFLVRDPEEDARLGLPENERIVILDDAFLDASGQFEPFHPPSDYPEDYPEALAGLQSNRLSNPVSWANYQTNGRDDERDGHGVLIVNGRADRTLPVEPGVPLRLRLLNTANSRFMRLNVPPAPPALAPDRGCATEERAPCHDLFLIGTDGGLLEAPQRRTPITKVVDPDPTHFGALVSDSDPRHGVMLTPGERADVVLTPTGQSGDLLPVEWHDWGRGRHMWFKVGSGDIVFNHAHGGPGLKHRTLFGLRLAGEGQPATYEVPEQLREIPRLDTTNARHLKLTMGHGTPDRDGDMLFWMQEREGFEPDDPERGLPFGAVTGSEANQATVGETVVWEVTNTAMGDHNFHPHGFMFQPIAIESVTCDPETGEIDPSKTFVETFDVQEKDSIRIPGPALPKCFFEEGTGRIVCPVCPPGTAYTTLTAAMRFDATDRENDIEAFGKIPQPTRSGGWMVHCHILEHAARGMMTYFELRK